MKRLMSKKKAAALCLGALVLFFLTACNMNSGAGDAGGTDNRDGGMRAQNNRTPATENRSEPVGQHANTRMEVSRDIADMIANMEEIEMANVLLTDRNAYIAVEMHVDDGAEDRGNGREFEPSEGTARSRNQADAPNLMDNRDDDAGRRSTSRNGRMNLDDEFTGDYDISDQVKQKIADQVRSQAPHIQNVFVSANPDFLERVDGFMDELENGKPIRGLVNEFNTMVERMFPESR